MLLSKEPTRSNTYAMPAIQTADMAHTSGRTNTRSLSPAQLSGVKVKTRTDCIGSNVPSPMARLRCHPERLCLSANQKAKRRPVKADNNAAISRATVEFISIVNVQTRLLFRDDFGRALQA